MKTVRIHKYGNPDVLQIEEIPVPVIAADELLIKVHATSVNPIDWKVMEGNMKEMHLHKLPLTLGWDCAGTVEKIGTAVTNFKRGDEVYCRPATERDGAYAEFIAVRANEVALKPRTISFEEAAAIPLAGITAWEALINRAHIHKDQRVLVLSASDGVGSLAVQLAKTRGCYVIGTTSAANMDFVKGLGPDEVYNYENKDFSDHFSDIDVVLDTIGGVIQDRAFKVLRRGGMLVSTVNEPKMEMIHKYGVRAEYVFAGPNATILNEIRTLVENGKMKPFIDKVFKLDEVKQAEIYSQSPSIRGKIVLRVAS